MKLNHTLATFVILAAFAMSQHSSAQTAPIIPPPQITVSGSAEVRVAPDEILLSVGVETRQADLNEAVRHHDARMADALAFLKSAGVPDKDVQTDYISVQPDYDHNVSRVNPVAYIVRKSIGVRINSVTNFPTLLTGLLNHGVNQVHDVDFRTTQLRQHRDQARAMAIRAAREKADALVGELGMIRGAPINISAQDSSGWWSGGYWGGRGANMFNNVQNVVALSDSIGAGETLALGQISVTASVNVSFLIH